MSLSPSLRKAAVLVAALDADAADTLLQQMSADDAAKIRSALVELDSIPADEQEHVLGEFLRRQAGSPPAALSRSDDVTLELNSEIEASASVNRLFPPMATPRPAEGSPSFDFLKDVEPKALAAVLHCELPQTIAVVVSRLSPQQAAAVLQELPATLATEALERIAWIDKLSPEVQADLVRGLRSQLAPHLRTAMADEASLSHLSAVLGAMDASRRQRIVVQLGQRNEALVNRLDLTKACEGHVNGEDTVIAMRYRLDSRTSTQGAPSRKQANTSHGDDSVWLAFEDLLQFNDAALRAVFAATDSEVALLALTGAEPRLIGRILKKLRPREAAVLRQRLEHPGPLRLRDVEQARFAVAAVASRLAHEGSIELPASVRFAAAI